MTAATHNATDILLTNDAYFRALDFQEWDILTDILAPDYKVVVATAATPNAPMQSMTGRDLFIESSRKIWAHVSAAQHYATSERVTFVAPDQATMRFSLYCAHIFGREPDTERADSGGILEHSLLWDTDRWRIIKTVTHTLWRDRRYLGLLSGTLRPNQG